MCSGHPTIEDCLDKLFGSGNWDRWGDADINRYSEAMGLARWKGGRREWAKCDTLNHFVSETVLPSAGSVRRFRVPGTPDRPAFQFYRAEFPDTRKLSTLDGFHTRGPGLQGFYTHHIVIRDNWEFHRFYKTESQRKRRRLEVLAHELTHAMQAERGQTRDEAEALKLMKCVTRDLTKEDQVSPKDSTIKLHRTTFTAIRCKMVQEWECASYVLQERPDKWEDLKTGDEEEDEEEDPEKPWCGLVYWDQGPGIGGPPPRFMCTGEGVRICVRKYKLLCGNAHAPGRPGALAAATCVGDQARAL